MTTTENKQTPRKRYKNKLSPEANRIPQQQTQNYNNAGNSGDFDTKILLELEMNFVQFQYTVT